MVLERKQYGVRDHHFRMRSNSHSTTTVRYEDKDNQLEEEEACHATSASSASLTQASQSTKPKFSFDFFLSAAAKEKKKADKQRYHEQQQQQMRTNDTTKPAKSLSSSPSTRLSATAPYKVRTGFLAKSGFRPPALAISSSITNQASNYGRSSSHSSIPTRSRSPHEGVRLCQSPGGRANVQLAVPVVKAAPSSHRHSASAVLSPLAKRYSMIVSPSRKSVAQRASTVEAFLSSWPRDMAVDCLTLCQPTIRRDGRAYIARLLQSQVFETRSTKWAPYALQLVRAARLMRQLTSEQAMSLRFLICAYVRHEVAQRTHSKLARDQQLQKKLTDYRVAMQCITGMTVIKYGRKGKPHATQLSIESGETLRWTSAKLSTKLPYARRDKATIALASVVSISCGPKSDVLARALEKGMLPLQDAKCTLSLVTPTRTLDVKAKSASEAEWLRRSFAFLVDLAQDQARLVAKQVELSIMKRIESLNVWKHGRKGRPHKTRMFVNRFGEISWTGRSGDSIQLDDVRAIRSGHATDVFARSQVCGLTSTRKAALCFSLVTPMRTLDLEVESEQLRDWFVVAFQYLIDKVQEKTAALKRDKAEKQLKLLQELSNGSGGGAMGYQGSSLTLPPSAHT